MAQLELSNGEIIQAPDGLSREEYDAIVDNYLSTGGEAQEETSQPSWMSKLMDEMGMAATETAFGGKALGKLAAGLVASPETAATQLTTAIPKQFADTMVNLPLYTGAGLADLAFNIPKYGIQAADKVSQIVSKSPAMVNPYADKGDLSGAQPENSPWAKELLDEIAGTQGMLQNYRQELKDETPIIATSIIPERLQKDMAAGFGAVGELMGVSPEDNPLVGMTNSVLGTARQLVTPEGILLTLPTLGSGATAQAAHKLLPLLFGPAAVEGAITEGGEAAEQIRQGNWGTATEKGMNAATQGILGALMLGSLTPKGGKNLGTIGKVPEKPATGPTAPTGMPAVADMSALANRGLPITLPGAEPSPAWPVASLPRVQPGVPGQAFTMPDIPSKRIVRPPVPSGPTPPDIATPQIPSSLIEALSEQLVNNKLPPSLVEKLQQVLPPEIPLKKKLSAPVKSQSKLSMIIDPITPLMTEGLGKLSKKLDDANLPPSLLAGLTKIEKQREAKAMAEVVSREKAAEWKLKNTDPTTMTPEEIDKAEMQIMHELMPSEYRTQLEQRGLPTMNRDYQTQGITAWLKKAFRNNIPEFEASDMKTGQEGALLLHEGDLRSNVLGHTRGRIAAGFIPSIKALRKMGIDMRDASNLLEYVESTPDGKVKWSPEAYPAKNGVEGIPEFTGKTPDPKVLTELGKIRQQFDALHSEFGIEGYHPRYVPRQPLIPGELPAGKGSIINPAPFKQRSWKSEPMELALDKIVDKYTAQLAKHHAFPKEFINKMIEQAQLYEWAGMPERAKVFSKITNEMLGFKDGGIAAATRNNLIKIWKEQGEEPLRAKMKELGLEERKMDKFLSEVRDQVAHAALGTNVSNIIAQRIQSVVGGTADVPIGDILGSWRGFTKAEKELLASVKDTLRPDVYDPLSVEKAEGFTSQTSNAVATALKAPGMPGMKLMDMIESSERNHAFIAAKRWWDRTKNKDSLLKNLDNFEVQAIRDAMKSGGDQAAAIEFAKLKTQKILGRYGKVNKPVGDFSKLAMFTTFGIHEFNKLFDDISKGRYKQAAKRVAYPMLPAMMAATLTAPVTGKDKISGTMYFHPTVGALQASSMSTPPYLNVFKEAMGKSYNRPEALPKNILKETMKLTPTTKLISKAVFGTMGGKKKASPKAGVRGNSRGGGRGGRKNSR